MKRKFSLGMAILVNSASRKIINDIRGLCLRLLFPSDRSFYDDIMIGSEPSLYACTFPSLVQTPFDGDLSDSPPPLLSSYNLMTNVESLDTGKVRKVFPQGLTQSRIPEMERKSFYDEDRSPPPSRLRPPVRKIIILSHLLIVYALTHKKSSYIRQMR